MRKCASIFAPVLNRTSRSIERMHGSLSQHPQSSRSGEVRQGCRATIIIQGTTTVDLHQNHRAAGCVARRAFTCLSEFCSSAEHEQRIQAADCTDTLHLNAAAGWIGLDAFQEVFRNWTRLVLRSVQSQMCSGCAGESSEILLIAHILIKPLDTKHCNQWNA